MDNPHLYPLLHWDSDIFYPLLSLPQFFIVNDLHIFTVMIFFFSQCPGSQPDFAVIIDYAEHISLPLG